MTSRDDAWGHGHPADWSVNDDFPVLVAHMEHDHAVAVSDDCRSDPTMRGAYERLHLTFHGALVRLCTPHRGDARRIRRRKRR